MAQLLDYYYNEQIKKFTVQFMAVFANMKVKVGRTGDKEPRLITVPIVLAHKDRVAAAIINENTQNKPIRLPIMSAQLVSLEYAADRAKGIGNVREKSFVPIGGVVPDDIKVVRQRMPVPYNAYYELGLWASNTEQMHQMLEQILMLFDPLIQLQSNDETFDWTKISIVELTGIRPEENIPSGTERRIIRYVLEFRCPIWIAAPAEVHDRFIQTIRGRVFAVAETLDTAEDIIAYANLQGIPYEIYLSLDDVTI